MTVEGQQQLEKIKGSESGRRHLLVGDLSDQDADLVMQLQADVAARFSRGSQRPELLLQLLDLRQQRGRARHPYVRGEREASCHLALSSS